MNEWHLPPVPESSAVVTSKHNREGDDSLSCVKTLDKVETLATFQNGQF